MVDSYLYIVWIVGVEVEVLSSEGWFSIHGCTESLICARKDNLLSRSFSIRNCIDGWIEFTWSISAWTSFWWGQRRNVSSTYLSHIDGFSDVELKAISLKSSMYTLANTRDNGDPIARFSSCWYMSGSIPKYVVFTQKINISIRLSTGIQVHSSSEGYVAKLSCTAVRVSLIGTFVNRFTASRPTIWLEWMGALPIIYFMVLFTNPSAQAGYDTRSIFKRSLTGLNSEFPFS